MIQAKQTLPLVLARPPKTRRSRVPRCSAFDVAIVGSGIAGCSIAYRICKSSEDVSVCMASDSDPGTRTSSAGQGYLWRAYRTPGTTEFQAASEALDIWRETAKVLGPGAIGFSVPGSLLVAANDGQLEALEGQYNKLKEESGVVCELVSGDAVREIGGSSLRPSIAAVLKSEGDALVDPPAATKCMFEFARSHGNFTFIKSKAKLDPLGGVTLESGKKIDAREVVLATGPWMASEDFLPELGIKPRRGALIVGSAPTGRHLDVKIPLMEMEYAAKAKSVDDFAISSSVVQKPDGTVLVGASREFVGFDDQVDAGLITDILERASGMVEGLEELVVKDVRVGFRPWRARGPVVGPVEGRNVVMCGGFEGSGILFSVFAADLVARWVLQGDGRWKHFWPLSSQE